MALQQTPERKTDSVVREKVVAEELWLNCFHRYLFDHGIISEGERSPMTALIAERKPHSGR